MEIFILGILKIIFYLAKDHISSMKDQTTKVIYKMVENMVMENNLKQMVIIIKVHLSRAIDKEMDFINILQQVNNITEIGKTTINTDLAHLYLHMEINMKVIGLITKEKGRVNWFIQMALSTRDSLGKIFQKDMELFITLPVIDIREIG